MFANPNTPNLPDFRLFVANAMDLRPGLVPQPLAAPATPSLSAGSGGTLSGPVYVVLTYVSQNGETTASAEATITTGPDGTVTIASPAATPNATGYNAYAAATTGMEVLQNTSPVAIGTPLTLTALAAGTASPPTQNTSGSPYPEWAFGRAAAFVIPPPPCLPGIDYSLAYYNCAGHIMLTMIPAQPGQPTFPEVRRRLGLNSSNFGIVSAAADQGTSDVLAVPKALQELTLSDLQFAQSQWGRAYLAYNQSFGDIFGIS